MRDDRRSVNELQSLIDRRVRFKLTSWEKRNILDLYKKHISTRGFQENCTTCWANAIKELSKMKGLETVEAKPILVKEKMIVHTKPISKEIEKEIDEMVSNEKEENLYLTASKLAEAKGIKKPHPKTGEAKLKKFIADNQ